MFADEFIPRGAVVLSDVDSCELISADEYGRLQSRGDERVILTGYRFAADKFICAANQSDFAPRAEDFVNHSEDPSLLLHCGLFFALRDVIPGEELTAHYKYLLAENDITSFIDVGTGRRVSGLGNRDALLESTLELASLLGERPRARRVVRRMVRHTMRAGLTAG